MHYLKLTLLILVEVGVMAFILLGVTRYVIADNFVESWPEDAAAPADCQADFIVFGDSQGSFSLFWTISPNYENMLGLMNEIDANMAFHVGDMYVGDTFFASGVEKQAEWFLEDMETFDIPWYPVMGNHDAEGKGWDVTKEMIFEDRNTYYSFDQGDNHFIILDAFMPGYENTLSEEQFKWLQNDLATTIQPNIFVFVHAPLYPLGWHLGGSLDKDVIFRDRLASLFVDSGVDIVFCGHEHFYASFEYCGLMQVTTGGAAAELKSPAEFGELTSEFGYTDEDITRWVAKETSHYICVSSTSDTITVTAFDVKGNIIDQFSLSS